MKKLSLLAMVLMLGLCESFAQYPIITVRQMQEQPQDSLLLADNLQATQAPRWTLQASPRIRHVSPFAGDTVTVVALVAVPAKVLTFTNTGFTMLLYDTSANPYPFGGVFVRATSDTNTHIADGILNPQRGAVIAMTGVVSEFPTTYNSVTQFQPIPNIPITILATGRTIPPPPTITIDQFYTGLFPAPGLPVRFSTGERYEGLMVQIVNTVLDAKVNTGRGTFSIQDANGNQITMYDASKFFTKGHGTIVGPPDPIWQAQFDSVAIGTRVDTIRGFITTVSGSENPRGYRIAPVYRGDVVFGRVPLAVTTHRRNPVVVPPESLARVSAIVR